MTSLWHKKWKKSLSHVAKSSFLIALDCTYKFLHGTIEVEKSYCAVPNTLVNSLWKYERVSNCAEEYWEKYTVLLEY